MNVIKPIVVLSSDEQSAEQEDDEDVSMDKPKSEEEPFERDDRFMSYDVDLKESPDNYMLASINNDKPAAQGRFDDVSPVGMFDLFSQQQKQAHVEPFMERQQQQSYAPIGDDSDSYAEDMPSETYEPTYHRPKDEVVISDDDDDESQREDTYEELPNPQP